MSDDVQNGKQVNPPPSDDLDALAALAQAATPGNGEDKIPNQHTMANEWWKWVYAVSAFREAASPDVILSLVEELRTIKSHRAGCTSLLGQAVARAVAAESRVAHLESLLAGLKEAHTVTANEREQARTRVAELEQQFKVASGLHRSAEAELTKRDQRLVELEELLAVDEEQLRLNQIDEEALSQELYALRAGVRAADALYYFHKDAISLPCPECGAEPNRACFETGFGVMAHVARLPEGYVNQP